MTTHRNQRQRDRRARLIAEGKCPVCAEPADRLPLRLCSICALKDHYKYNSYRDSKQPVSQDTNPCI